MIAAKLVERKTRFEKPRTIRAATQRRIGRSLRARHAALSRICVALFCVLALLMGYVMLTSSLTGLSYAEAKAQAKREALQEETMRLDDRIAALRSDDRLAALAIRLGMREPYSFAVVRVEAPRVARARPPFPVFSSLAGLFAPAAAARP
jgi:cell division protein FtsL